MGWYIVRVYELCEGEGNKDIRTHEDDHMYCDSEISGNEVCLWIWPLMEEY